jgi:hypothetical protein
MGTPLQLAEKLPFEDLASGHDFSRAVKPFIL